MLWLHIPQKTLPKCIFQAEGDYVEHVSYNEVWNVRIHL